MDAPALCTFRVSEIRHSVQFELQKSHNEVTTEKMSGSSLAVAKRGWGMRSVGNVTAEHRDASGVNARVGSSNNGVGGSRLGQEREGAGRWQVHVEMEDVNDFGGVGRGKGGRG